ncbi:nuclear factor 7, ovary-like [Gastrophryne carolinensis]
MASADLTKELECSICLEIYTEPVTLKCGHNFCRVCIDRVLQTQEGSGHYSCPECREESHERPALHRNITLGNIAEYLLASHKHQEENVIFCTYCIHISLPAVKSCLHCDASLCEDHLRVHSKSLEHVLSDPTTYLENKQSCVHQKVLEYGCTDNTACICVSCMRDGHEKKTLDGVSKKNMEALTQSFEKLMIEREAGEQVQSLQIHLRKIQKRGDIGRERVSALFRDLRKQLEDLEKQVLSEISRKTEHLLRSDLFQQLELQKEEHSSKTGNIEELHDLIKHLTGPQESLYEIEGIGDRERHEKVHDEADLDVDSISHTFYMGLSEILRYVNRGIHIPSPDDISLDINTAHNNLRISNDRKAACKSDLMLNRPEMLKRFQLVPQVLSSQSFSGRHRWEVDVGESDRWRVGMCYPSIDRGGKCQSSIGDNYKSWALFRDSNRFSAFHGRRGIQLAGGMSSNRLRIVLNYDAGHISFYDLCDPIRHLHTFSATFTEPLHVAICVRRGCVKIVSDDTQ